MRWKREGRKKGGEEEGRGGRREGRKKGGEEEGRGGKKLNRKGSVLHVWAFFSPLYPSLSPFFPPV